MSSMSRYFNKRNKSKTPTVWDKKRAAEKAILIEHINNNPETPYFRSDLLEETGIRAMVLLEYLTEMSDSGFLEKYSMRTQDKNEMVYKKKTENSLEDMILGNKGDGILSFISSGGIGGVREDEILSASKIPPIIMLSSLDILSSKGLLVKKRKKFDTGGIAYYYYIVASIFQEHQEKEKQERLEEAKFLEEERRFNK